MTHLPGPSFPAQDQKKPHFLNIVIGLSQSFCAAALTYYLASVFKNSYSGKKADKSPWKQQGALKWEQGNYHPMAKWFIAHHELFSLARIFTLAIVIALSLSTGAYMIDEAIITGKNGGVPLAENRSDALFKLDTIQGAPEFGPELVALVETVMYGAPRNHPTTNGQAAVIVGHLSLPSTYALVNNKYSLESLKVLSNTLYEQLDLTADAPTRRGRFFVFDYLNFPHSSQAVDIMAGSGLTPGSICLRTDQLPNMCGYLCAGVALLLHGNGLEFADIPCATLPALNSQVRGRAVAQGMVTRDGRVPAHLRGRVCWFVLSRRVTTNCNDERDRRHVNPRLRGSPGPHTRGSSTWPWSYRGRRPSCHAW